MVNGTQRTVNGVSSEGERDGSCLLLYRLAFSMLGFFWGGEFLAESRLISVDAVILFFQQ